MAYGDFKDSNKGTFANQVLQDKAFNIASNILDFPKYDGYQRGLK